MDDKQPLLRMIPGLVSLVKEEVGKEDIDKVEKLTFTTIHKQPRGVIVAWSGRLLPARWIGVYFTDDGNLVTLYREWGDGNSR